MSKSVVLIVDDEPLLRMDAVEFLEDAGFVTVEANGADQALEIMRSRSDIAALFTDIEMPGSMNGVELAFAVRAGWPPVMIVVASGRVTPQTRDLPVKARFLKKPYWPKDVILALRTAA